LMRKILATQIARQIIFASTPFFRTNYFSIGNFTSCRKQIFWASSEVLAKLVM
jgi:hypothetical protein